MKNLFKTLCIIILGFTYCNVNAQTAEKQKEEQAWKEYMQPGTFHKMLAKADGEWQEEITMWMTPEAVPTKSMATVSNKMILDGRYQYSTHKGQFNGNPFEGVSILGYDNAKKVFVNTWIDNMGTGIMVMQGPWNEITKSIKFTGSFVDPVTGKDMAARQTMKWIDDNTQTIEMFVTQDGKETKTMEVLLSRKTKI